jgi:glycine cleavage system H protein
MPYPTDRKYTKEHEWITADGTIGITHYAQESLGDIVFVDLPKVGTELTAGKTFGTVESVKAVSDLYAPASGTVAEINGELATSPENVNKDAHGSWMVKLKLKDPGELNALLSAADYENLQCRRKIRIHGIADRTLSSDFSPPQTGLRHATIVSTTSHIYIRPL